MKKKYLTRVLFVCLVDCANKTCGNGEVLDEKCRCYCPDGATCGTKDDKRNGTGKITMSVNFLNNIPRNNSYFKVEAAKVLRIELNENILK